MKKRVYCLYRVSTKRQVEKDDIPMQKQACHAFAEQRGWEIVRELFEKGVSGFKVSANDREAIQEMRQDALRGRFDILLVFMFDRLGRRENETPFVAEWFAQKGIEVWSTVEGQQRFETDADKILNYIRYWQASGESVKKSICVKTRMGQIVQEGHFRGGVVSYGFRLTKKGRMGRNHRELYDIEINPEEAAAIREMFRLADQFGYGGRRISRELQERGMMNLRTGKPFHFSNIQYHLRNIQNAGVLRSGESRSEVIPELAIVSMEQFQRVQKRLAQRATESLEQEKQPSGPVQPEHCRGKGAREPWGRELEAWERLLLAAIVENSICSPEQIRKRLDKVQPTTGKTNGRRGELGDWLAEAAIKQLISS